MVAGGSAALPLHESHPCMIAESSCIYRRRELDREPPAASEDKEKRGIGEVNPSPPYIGAPMGT